MYRLYNFHLLNNQPSQYNVKISPDNVAPSQAELSQPKLGGIRSKPLTTSRNFLSIIENASLGKRCSSCGGR